MSGKKVALIVTLVAFMLGIIGSLGYAQPKKEKQVVWRFQSEHARADRVPKYYEAVWVDEVNTRTGSQLRIDHFFSRGLGIRQDDVLRALADGLLEAGMVFTGSTAGTFPLGDVLDQPMLVPYDLKLRQRVIKEIVDPAIQNGIKKMKLNLMLIGPITLEPRSIYLAKKRVTSLADLKGLKIRGAGPLESEFTKLLGASPVTIGGGEIFSAMQTGVIDGFWITHGFVFDQKIHEVAKYCYEIEDRGPLTYIGIYKSAFDNLDPAKQQAVMKAAEAAQASWYGAFDTIYEQKRKALLGVGMEFNRATAEDIAIMNEVAERLRKPWGKERGADYLQVTSDIEQFVAASGKR